MISQNTLGRDFKHKLMISRLFLAIQSAVKRSGSTSWHW
ncbi:hypothetical protein SLEP1_g53847 [Rubroshorea leprosula]|uniref:Uncharacterized protein n=1 Tax=Rubroshorea leprosula TaxID=152421 RepID=A0AAV5MDE8_9ROSI|nr:hypothetical protein SLEP1_g53847 [Rubroshorea leprosula]